MFEVMITQRRMLIAKGHPGIDAGILAGWCALIFFLSSQSTLPMPPLFPHGDKVIHAGAYAVMGVAAWRIFQHLPWPVTLHVLYSICFCSLYGVSDEWHQSFVPGRDSDVMDWLADTVGAASAVFFMQWMKQNYSRSFTGT